MNLHFYKYQGAGNDFILLDNRDQQYSLSTDQIALLCDRRFGVGADGLMFLEHADGYDFRMVYYNADGNESTMCGNGGRCITLFAKDIGIIDRAANFIAIDGAHSATVIEENIVKLSMVDVGEIIFNKGATILNTGSPHIVIPVENVTTIDIKSEGSRIRHQDRFGEKGINVNFVSEREGTIHIGTYERGVEDETLACGTGVTAAAISAVGNAVGSFEKQVKAKGGDLKVAFIKDTVSTARQITLTGSAKFVFKGVVDL